jgi:hypothetical protein
MTPADLKRLHKYMLEIEPPRKSTIPFDTWLTRISAILQIIAIPAAAYWAFTRFQAEDAPALEHRAKIRAELSWTYRSKEECIAQFSVTFENIGKSSIDLIEAVVRAYPLDAPTLKDDSIAYVDPEELRKNLKPLVEADIRRYLWQRFSPGVADEVGTMFLVRRSPGKMIMFFVDAKSAVSETLIDRLFWFLPRKEPHSWSWLGRDFRCGESELQFRENFR